MSLYKVKRHNGEILGPFSEEEIKKLYIKGEIDGKDQCQKDSDTTEWSPVSSLEEIRPLIEGPSSSHKELKEFSYDTSENVDSIEYEELQKKYEDNKDKRSEDLEETVIKKRKRYLGDMDKTIIIERTEEIKEKEDKKQQERMVQNAKDVIEEDVVSTEAETEVINTEDILPKLQREALESEIEIKRIKNVKKNFEKDNSEEEWSEKDDGQKKDKPKKTIKPITALVIVILFYFLVIEEDEKKPVPVIRPNRISVVFPVQNEYIDEKIAEDRLLEGIELYRKESYLTKAIAIVKFHESLRNKFEDNAALGFLILSYAELLPNTKDKKKAMIVLNNLIRIAGNKAFSDINVAMGKALYFLNSGRTFTAIKSIEDYIKITKKPTRKFYSIYLKALTISGNFEKAERAYEMLEKSGENLPVLAYKVMAEYHEKNQNYDKAEKLIVEGLNHFPNSVMLLLKQADYSFRIGNLKLYEKILVKIEKLGYESCPEFYAKYLEHLGVVSAMKGNAVLAAKLFRQSLKEHETLELRSKLSTLEVEGGNVAKSLILESKIIDQMRKAEKARKEYKWDQAFIHAINAVDMNNKYIPAHILLSDIQIERGYFESSIKTLKKLKEFHPTNLSVLTNLIDAYIESHRYHDAMTEISLLSSIQEIIDSSEYAFILAKYFEKIKLYMLAISWYKKSIQRDPLLDRAYFAIAKIYKMGNRLKLAKRYLIEAMNLNVEETKYKILYSQILAQEDKPSVIIGYLRKELEKSNDKTAILGEIAVNYYKSGQIKYFEDTYKKIKELHVKNESFYNFLIKASHLNDEEERIIEYSNELIKIKPGAMNVRIDLAEVYLKKMNFVLAIEQLMEVKKRMSDFPKVNYYLAKVHFLKNELDKAMELATIEIKKNPRSPFGLLIQGKILLRLAMGKDDGQEMEKIIRKSVKSYEKALVLDSNNIESLIDLAKIRKIQNRFDQARELLLRAERLEANRPDIHRELGYVYKGIGQGSLAIKSFERYITLAPGADDSTKIKNIMQLLR